MPRVVPLELYGGQPAQPTTIGDAIAERDRQARAKALGKALEKDDDGRMPNIQSVGQGMAYMAQKAVEGIAARREVDQAEAGRKALGQALLNMVDSQRAAGAAAGAPSSGSAPAGKVPSFARADLPSSGYTAGLTPNDRDLAVRTVLAEAGSQGEGGMQAVAGVLKNRARLAGTSIGEEALRPNQFEPWNAGSGNDPRRFKADSPEYQRAAAAIAPVLDGDLDPTNGATHFYAPKAQAALGRKAPSWDNGAGVDIGDHRFFKLPYGSGGRTRTADMPAAGATPVGMDASAEGDGFVIPPGPDTPAPTAREALERAAATVDAREAPPSPADLPAPGAAPTGFDAMGNSDGYFVPPGQQDAPLQPPPASAASASADPDVAALFSSQPMGPAQSFAPPDPAPTPDVPLPPQRPADLSVSTAPMPGVGSDAAPPPPGAPSFANGQAPLPPPRPPELTPADLPAPGAQPTMLPPQAAANPRTTVLAQALQGAGGDLNSNDAGAGAFARSGAMGNGPGPGPLSPRVAALARGLDPQAIPPDASMGAGAPTAAAPPPGAPQVPLTLNGEPSAPQGAPVQVAQAGGAPQGAASNARPAAAQDPRDAYARAIIASPYATDTMVRWGLEQLGPGKTSTVDLGDSVGVLNGRGEMVRSLPKTRGLMNVTAGTTVLDPNTGRPVFTAPKEPELTPDQRNYAAAREGGYRGDFNSFLQQKSQREAKEVTVTRPDGQKESFMYDPQTNTLRTPEQMGAPPYVPQAPANPYAPGGAGGKPLTEDQAKSAGFANRMAQSHGIVNEVETQGTKGIPQGLSKLPVIGNYLSAPDLQKYNQGKSEFITALLRRESGAAIGKDEFTRYDREFFPQPGDDPGTIAQKRAAREGAIKGTMIGAGPNYTPPAGFGAPAAPAQDAPQPPAAASGDGRAPSAPVAVQSPDDVSRLPSGVYYRRPDGAVMRKR